MPLEEAINGVENMLYMTSSANSYGSASINVYFRQGTDADIAMVNVQNRISSAMGLLPAEVTESGVSVKQRQTSTLKMVALQSPDNRFDDVFIANYMMINIEPRLTRISGVGDVNVRGASYALRIWLDPQKMKHYKLIPSDIRTALDQQNLESPTGTLGADSDDAFQIELSYSGRLEDERDYENIVIKSLDNGEVLYLKDVSKIELGARDYNYTGNISGRFGRIALISQSPGSNAMEATIAVDEELDRIRAELPEGLRLVDVMNTKDFLDASFRNVYITLLQAILLVILVVYIFLQNARSTFIPSMAIIVSLVASFAFIYLMGFSLNLLTLFALVLVIGTVVDDAIVVVEAVQSKFDGGEKSPYIATIGAMKEVTSALITTTIVFMAVFIPVSFMGGTTGTFFTQFGLTMAVAVAISTVNAMTLSPALCALIMRPHHEYSEGERASFSVRFNIAFNEAFDAVVKKYQHNVLFFLKHKVLASLMIVFACGGLYYMMNHTKTALVPNEDMGAIFISVQTPPGYTREQTGLVMKDIESRIQKIDDIHEYSMISGVDRAGNSGGNAGMFVIRLKNWDERPDDDQSVSAITNKIYALTADITHAIILVNAPPMITGYGSTNGFEVHIQDRAGRDIKELEKYTQQFIRKLIERDEVVRAQTVFNTKFPQYSVKVNAEMAIRNGISPSLILNTISGYVGGNYVSNMNRFSKLYRVMIQAPAEDRLSLKSLDNIYVRNNAGEMSPVSQYVEIERVSGPQSLSRFNLFPSISVNGMPAEGYSSGQAIEAIREVADEVLPQGYGYEFGGMSREESEASTNTTALIFAISIIFVYLVLCALYESFFVPLAVILAVPFGLLGSYLFVNMYGISSDIYMQTGIVMLIGLLAKTAILLTEYASEQRKRGMSISQAAISASKRRLRPILMTSLTLIFGMLPLMFATGVGAKGNVSLGVGVVGGMFIGTIALIFIVPALFVIFKSIEEKIMPERKLPEVDIDKL